MDVGGGEVGKGLTMVSDHAITLDVEDGVGCVPQMAISEHAVTLDVENGVGFPSIPQLAVYVPNPEFASVSDHAVTLDVEDGVGFPSVPQMAVYFTNFEFASVYEHAITLDVEEGEGIQVFHKLVVYVYNEEDCWKTNEGAGSSGSGGGQQGSLMDKEWGMSTGSKYAPWEIGSSTEGTVSMVDESCEAVGGSSSKGNDTKKVHADSAEGNGKGKSRKRRREPSMEGRQWRQKVAGDGFMFDKEGRGLRGVVLVSVRGRCTLEKIYKFNKTLEPYQKEAIEGTILKPILEYHPFSMFSSDAKIVELGEDDLSTTALARMVRLRIAQYVTEKSDNLKSEKGRKRPVFRNYIKVMKKLLDVNKEPEKLKLWLSLFAWRVMSGVMFPRTPYGAAWSVQKYIEDVRKMSEYAWTETRKLEWPIFDVQMNGFSLLIQCSKVEHAGEIADDAAVTPCREDNVSAQKPAREQQQPAPEVGEPGAMPVPYVGEAVASTDGPGPAVAEVYIGGASAVGEGECTPPASSAANDEDCTHVVTDGGKLRQRMIPGWSPCTMHHQLQQTALLLIIRHVCSPRWVTSEIGEIPGETERTSPDADDVGCRDDGGGNNSNIVTRGSLEVEKLTVVHGSPFTDPTRLSGARKSKKEMKEGVTGVDEPHAVDEPSEGSVDPPVLNVQPLLVEGSGIGPSMEELNKIKLTKQVLVGYISAPLSVTEIELVTKVRTRPKGVKCQTVCYFVLDMCADIDGQGGGHARVSAEARAGKLVKGLHPCGSKWGSRGQVTLHNKGRISGVIWDNFKATPQSDVRYVFMPQLETTDGHWLLLIADLQEHSFLVYDSLPSLAVKTRRELLDSTVSPGLVTLLFVCLDSGHDCGVFVMAFMDLLSLKADGFEFDQDCVVHYRDKCLLSFIQGLDNIYEVCFPLIQSYDICKVEHVFVDGCM
ncbi:LOW QUALITY PROTEIN: hypothetical protein Cgig2_013827 [Carnegiea gigantea]|uniref:Ubiquitin-like protease family profile domain-containing protein n=1 Tax=Carnegiea gigantea TaxID=171969 RepID=A0A9Q1JWM0_9CARY|nr:LOW QUALITY PROTEIN: hypothetical protein Cgig2_013827 [Carnegiea gigantea]